VLLTLLALSCGDVITVPMRLFKGASAGSHWFDHDPRLNNGFLSSPGTTNVDSIVAHITNYSHPSPYLSFTASPAIARGYALPLGGTKGRIYEIDTTVSSLQLVDPVAEIAKAYGNLGTYKGPVWATHHDGDAGLLSALASGVPPPAPVAHRRGTTRTPTFMPHLQALVFALRDAEVLIVGNPPASCIVDSWDVP
jgi:hypothetical protein